MESDRALSQWLTGLESGILLMVRAYSDIALLAVWKSVERYLHGSQD
jgi:hypothetical protein